MPLSASSPRLPPHSAHIIPMVVAVSLFLENLDSTVVTTALPAIAQTMGVSPVHLSLAITAYILSDTVFLPASGWVADRLGGRVVFSLAVGVFLAGSILCGFSTTLPVFVLGRMIQGAGGAMMIPVSRLIILRTTPRESWVEGMTWFTMPALIGPIIGPPVGGFFTTYLSWPWIFWINVPIGIAGIVLTWVVIPPMSAVAAKKPFDLPGFVLSGFALSAFVAGLESVGRNVIPLWGSAAVVGLSLLSAWAYMKHAGRVRFPLVDPATFRFPVFRLCILAGFGFRIGVGAAPFLLPLMFQISFGLNPFHAGLLSCTSALGAFSMKSLVRSLLRRHGFRIVLTASGVLASVLLAVNGLFTTTTPQWLIVAILFAGGLARSLHFTALNTLTVAEVGQREMSNATTIMQMGMQVARSLGIATAALGLWLLGAGSGHVEAILFLPVFAALGLVGGVSSLSFRTLPPGVASEISGQKRP